MNQLVDILNTKANDLFGDLSSLDVSPTSEEQTGNIQQNDVSTQQIDTPVSLNLVSHINITHITSQLYSLKDQVDRLIREINHEQPKQELMPTVATQTTVSNSLEKIIEGVFNGEKMVGPDGQEYVVPPNYASKSKLVEGDFMKLTITPAGTFIYKQIGPVARKRLIGILSFDEEKQTWSVHAEGRPYKVLTASITFHRGKPHDEIVILVPKDSVSEWAAVENIMSH